MLQTLHPMVLRYFVSVVLGRPEVVYVVQIASTCSTSNVPRVVPRYPPSHHDVYSFAKLL